MAPHVARWIDAPDNAGGADAEIYARRIREMAAPRILEPDQVRSIFEARDQFVIIDPDFDIVAAVDLDRIRRLIVVSHLLPLGYLADGSPNPDGRPLRDYLPALKLLIETVHDAMNRERGYVGSGADPGDLFEGFTEVAVFDGLPYAIGRRAAEEYQRLFPGSTVSEIERNGTPRAMLRLSKDTEKPTESGRRLQERADAPEPDPDPDPRPARGGSS